MIASWRQGGGRVSSKGGKPKVVLDFPSCWVPKSPQTICRGLKLSGSSLSKPTSDSPRQRLSRFMSFKGPTWIPDNNNYGPDPWSYQPRAHCNMGSSWAIMVALQWGRERRCRPSMLKLILYPRMNVAGISSSGQRVLFSESFHNR